MTEVCSRKSQSRYPAVLIRNVISTIGHALRRAVPRAGTAAGTATRQLPPHLHDLSSRYISVLALVLAPPQDIKLNLIEFNVHYACMTIVHLALALFAWCHLQTV